MLRRRGTGLLLGETHRHALLLQPQLHHVHTGHATGVEHLLGRFAAIKTGEQHATRLIGQIVANQVLFFGDIVVIVTDQHFKAARAHDLVDGLQGLDEQLVGQRRNQHHDRLALRRGQRPGRRVGDITEGGCCQLDLLDQLRGNGADPAQGARSGNRGNPGKPGHFSQSGTTGSTGADAGHGELYFRLAKNGERALR
ncbi:hypothetical protein D3C77_403240 [compost metagenome]